ncbi:MAG: hypothetical protein Q8R28_02290 [Dehalococcoidia bacterium]|nr:hypothetical protein [Dehalococcoidia bacterium]
MDEIGEIQHVELEAPKIFDAITFLTQFGPLGREYPDEKAFREDIRSVIQNYLAKNNLTDSYKLLSCDLDRESISAASIFGAEFVPDLVLEQDGEPVAAILVKLVKTNPHGLVQAVGRAVIFSHRYPWVLSLVLDKGKRRRESRKLDHQFRADMWHNRRVRFLFR